MIIGMLGALGKCFCLMLMGPSGAKAAPTAMPVRIRAGTPEISGANVGTGSAAPTCLTSTLTPTRVVPSSKSPARTRRERERGAKAL
ncbi:hypothetical protein C8R45DRAFT_1035150 [Mycena sanguinolenta]|nr:hypothetical protein C8R45DRAFT_1035150 [Mycena sanguinolenta]